MEPTGIVFVEVDDLGPVERTLGRRMGNELMRSVAERLSEPAGPGGTVARLGDRFLVRASDEDGALPRRLAEAFAKPIPLAGTHVHVTVTVTTGVGYSAAALSA